MTTPATPQPGAPVDPYRAYNFKLLINGITNGHFTEVSGLEVTIARRAYREAGNDRIRAVPCQVDYAPVTLHFGLTSSRELWDWVQAAARGTVNRRNVSVVLLDAAEASARCAAEGVLGATYTPHCAVVHPAKLVRGLARAVERRGVTIHERTQVTVIRAGAAVTAHGTVRAPVVVRATEGYTPGLPGQRRAIAPVYSLMVATEPLPAQTWDRIGLAERETFSDHRHVIIYGQRTADGRLAFGGRGAPYHFGSRVSPAYDREPAVFRALRRVLGELFPVLGPEVPVSHTWGGPLGVARDWSASVGLDRATGLGWAGGYVGDGVGTSNLAGRTLADLIRGVDSGLTTLPWVNHRSPKWEPEPLRWLAVNAGLKVMFSADAAEARKGRPSRRAAAFSRLLGH
ncbi:FAD-dependent oxidoreductase [Micromonospora sp. 4G55]|uniref:FAD-dependent oxidoreductase n=1 Tax=Micromonospora sp. 4G55 TaxID=2806102 RepID=UPI001A5168DF|nr:FAD-dependent oxidoreductase [Micromonospora sp. 4G55]MBM0257326.1 FAD-dependent oxidoreductase [Micromonospora sp. 4G55]